MTLIEPAAPRPSGSEREVPQQILVVDDEPGIRQLAARILLEEGYHVHQAGDGREALDFMSAGALVDAVVSDIVMPRINGIELVEMLSRSHPGVPVVLMSGYAIDELARRGIAAPCAVLGKPFAPERLVFEVRRCIGERM